MVLPSLPSRLAPLILLALAGAALATSPSQNAKPTDDIRLVDFMDYSYGIPPDAARELHLPSPVKVQSGKFRAGKGIHASVFEVQKVIYGDVTGDAQEEAAVVTCYGPEAANGCDYAIYVYRLRPGGQPDLIWRLGDERLSKDYTQQSPEGDLYGLADNGVEIADRRLVVRREADGAHCCPESLVTFRYLWKSGRFRLDGGLTKAKLPPAPENASP